MKFNETVVLVVNIPILSPGLRLVFTRLSAALRAIATSNMRMDVSSKNNAMYREGGGGGFIGASAGTADRLASTICGGGTLRTGADGEFSTENEAI